MKTQEVRKYIEECRMDNGILDEEELIGLVLWAYDKGWSEGMEEEE